MTGTRTPYSDQWREHTRARMQQHGLSAGDIGKMTGLGYAAVASIWHNGEVSLEVAGPIDEELDRLDSKSDADALEHGGRKFEAVHHDGTRHRVERVAVKLDRLTNMDGEVQP